MKVKEKKRKTRLLKCNKWKFRCSGSQPKRLFTHQLQSQLQVLLVELHDKFA